MPTYELTFVLDPRLPDEETQALCDEYKQMIEAAGGRVEHRDDWGKRQLAYPIGKLEEGRYFLWHLSSDNGNPTQEVEHRMRQKEEVLRFLTVRTEKLDFDATAAEAAEDGVEKTKAAGAEPAPEETRAAPAEAETTVTETAAPAPVATAAPAETPEPEPETVEAAAPESPAPVEAAVPEAAADSDAAEPTTGEEAEGDTAASDDETPSEEEAR